MSRLKITPSTDIAVIYARYSSARQRDVSIDDQVAECNRYAKDHGLRIAHVYSDRAISGRTDNRPQFQEMITDSASCVFSKVLVYKLDRFARDRSDSAIYRKKLEKNGVEIVSVTEHIDKGPEGSLVTGIFEAINEYYSRNLSVQVMRGMRGNADRCMTNGLRVFGYKTAINGCYEPDETEAPLVREMFERYVHGKSATDIATWLSSVGIRVRGGGKPTGKWVLRRIHDERYIGVYKWDDRRIEDGMPAIVDKDVWDQAQVRKRPAGCTNYVHDYPLSGKLYEMDTGTPMCGYSAHGKSGKSYSYYAVTINGRRHTVTSWKVDNAVAECVRDLFSDPDVAHDTAKRVVEFAESRLNSPESASMSKRLRKLEKDEQNINNAIVNGGPLDVLLKRLDNNKKEMARLRKKLSKDEFIVPSEEEIEDWIINMGLYQSDEEIIEHLVESVSLNIYDGSGEVVMKLQSKTPSNAKGIGTSDGVRIESQWWAVVNSSTNTTLRLKAFLFGVIAQLNIGIGGYVGRV